LDAAAVQALCEAGGQIDQCGVANDPSGVKLATSQGSPALLKIA
jgi:hypothetical protein